MKKLILIIVVTLFYCNAYTQSDTARTKPRFLMIVGNVLDSINPNDVEVDLSAQLFVFSEDNGQVLKFYASDNGGWGMYLDPGTYKVVFSKLGYKSKMLVIEVESQKPKKLPWYEIRMGIDLVKGIDKREIKPSGKIFYNIEEDGYQFVKY